MKIEVKRTEFIEARAVYTYNFDEKGLANFNRYLTELFESYGISVEPVTMEEVTAYINFEDVDKFCRVYDCFIEEEYVTYVSIEGEFHDWINLTTTNQSEYEIYYDDVMGRDSETDFKVLED